MKHREEHARLAFDEQRAINDIQNLQRDIQEARGQRERAEAEFDAFLRGFRSNEPEPQSRKGPSPALKPAPPPSSAPPAVRPAMPPAAAPVVVPPPRVAEWEPPPAAPERSPAAPVELPRPSDPVPAGAAAEHQAIEPQIDAPASPETNVQARKPVVAPTRARNVNAAIAMTIGALVVAGAVVAVRSRRADPIPAQEGAPAVVATTPQQPATNAAPPAQTAAPQPGVNLEMITLRAVWVRVTLDGRRAIERELDAGQRIPLHAEGTIVIRAGDAGAVSVRRDAGAEVRLGPDGVVSTRTFTAEPAPR